MQPTLAVFTVKKFVCRDGRYWTYGGFGDYVRALLPHFRRITLACHPRHVHEVPAGWYPLEAPTLEFAWLPWYDREDRAVVRLPEMLMRARRLAMRADLVNARVPDYSGLCGGYWARRLGKPLFVNLVDDWHDPSRWRTSRTRGLARALLRAHLSIYCRLETALCSSSLLFAQGEGSYARYRNNPRARLVVSSSHGDADVAPPRDTCRDPGRLRLLAVARLQRVKGHADLIQALALLAEGDRLASLTVVGEGPMRSECEALARKLGVEAQLSFAGQLDRTEIWKAYDASDVFCLASHSEGTPKVLLEAMARSLPVVATAVGGVPTVVKDGETGLLVPAGRPDILAAAIRRLATDGELRRRCLAGGRRMAQAHTVEAEWGGMVAAVREEYPFLWREG